MVKAPNFRDLYPRLPEPGYDFIDHAVMMCHPSKLRDDMRGFAQSLATSLSANINSGHLAGLPILDVGCGSGEFTAGLAEVFPSHEVYGVDISQGMIDLATSRYGSSQPNLTFLRADAQGIPTSLQGRVCLLTAIALLHNIDSLQGVLGQFNASLAPNGVFYLLDINPKSLLKEENDLERDLYTQRKLKGDLGICTELREAFESGDFDLVSQYAGFFSIHAGHTQEELTYALRGAGFNRVNIYETVVVNTTWDCVTGFAQKPSKKRKRKRKRK